MPLPQHRSDACVSRPHASRRTVWLPKAWRHRLLLAGVLVLMLCFSSRSGIAETYPDRPITYVVPSGPGSSPDIVGRIMAESLARILGKPVVVLNRPGAGGTVAAAAAAKAAPDGYTVLQANTNHSFSQTLYKTLSYDLEKDFTPVARFASAFYIVVTNPKLGVTTLHQFIDKAKALPGQLNYATGGVGSATFIVAEVLKAMAGLDMVHIPYPGGGPALTSIVSGFTDIYGSPYATAKPFVDEGKLVGLALTTQARVPFIPDVPTVAETLPGYEATTWYGLLVPAGTPPEIRDKLHAAIGQAIAGAEAKRRFEDLGYVTMSDTPAEFAAFVHEDIARMAKLIHQFNFKPE